MNVLPAGDDALLVELGDVSTAELHGAAARVRACAGVRSVTPGQASLYVIFDGTPDRGALRDALLEGETAPLSSRVLRVPVSFDGEDLPELLARIGISKEKVVQRVSTLRLVVRYVGFRGGFGYLDGWPEEWSMPRRPTSRPHVPRGTFAIAGNVAGFYPIDSPGGWNLLGRTDADLENALEAGDAIEIVPSAHPLEVRPRRGAEPLRLRRAEVIAAPLALKVDVPFDGSAAAIARSAVQGDVDLLECALAGPRLRMTADAVLAWCAPDLRVEVRRVRAGEEVAFGRIGGGLRAYLAIGAAEGTIVSVERDDRLVVRALSGPHDVGLGDVECEITPRLDRVGIRMRPIDLSAIAIPADLPSCGMQCGTVQLHPDGTLVAMGPDHPVTGGYLQPMTVLSSERWKLAQLMPGERVRFRVQRPK